MSGSMAALAVLEVIGLLVRGIVQLQRTAALSDAEIEARFQAVRAEFDQCDPSKLPKP